MLTGHCATLAQSVERLTRNEQVDSSILSSGSTALDVRRFSEHLGFCICASVRIGFRRARMVIARVAELVDAQDLGSCVFDVWVQVPSRAPFGNGMVRLASIVPPVFPFIPSPIPSHCGKARAYSRRHA